MKAASLLAVAATASLAILLAGCGDGDSSTTASSPQTTSSVGPTAGSDEEQIRTVAERYKTAVGESDPELLCEEVLPPSLLGGQIEACVDINRYAMEQSGADLGPGIDLTIDSVEIDGDEATAQVSDANVDTVDFLEEKGRWWMVVFSEAI